MFFFFESRDGVSNIWRMIDGIKLVRTLTSGMAGRNSVHFKAVIVHLTVLLLYIFPSHVVRSTVRPSVHKFVKKSSRDGCFYIFLQTK